jgi:hypothetical protein
MQTAAFADGEREGAGQQAKRVTEDVQNQEQHSTPRTKAICVVWLSPLPEAPANPEDTAGSPGPFQLPSGFGLSLTLINSHDP